MFCIVHKTTRHSPPKMTLTFAKLAEYMRKHETNLEVKGRDSAYSIPDAMRIGTAKFMASADGGTTETDEGTDPGWVGLQDDELEIDDDGSLDVE